MDYDYLRRQFVGIGYSGRRNRLVRQLLTEHEAQCRAQGVEERKEHRQWKSNPCGGAFSDSKTELTCSESEHEDDAPRLESTMEDSFSSPPLRIAFDEFLEYWIACETSPQEWDRYVRDGPVATKRRIAGFFQFLKQTENRKVWTGWNRADEERGLEDGLDDEEEEKEGKKDETVDGAQRASLSDSSTTLAGDDQSFAPPIGTINFTAYARLCLDNTVANQHRTNVMSVGFTPGARRKFVDALHEATSAHARSNSDASEGDDTAVMEPSRKRAKPHASEPTNEPESPEGIHSPPSRAIPPVPGSWCSIQEFSEYFTKARGFRPRWRYLNRLSGMAAAEFLPERSWQDLEAVWAEQEEANRQGSMEPLDEDEDGIVKKKPKGKSNPTERDAEGVALQEGFVDYAVFASVCTIDPDASGSSPFAIHYLRHQSHNSRSLVGLTFYIPFLILFIGWFLAGKQLSNGYQNIQRVSKMIEGTIQADQSDCNRTVSATSWTDPNYLNSCVLQDRKNMAAGDVGNFADYQSWISNALRKMWQTKSLYQPGPDWDWTATTSATQFRTAQLEEEALSGLHRPTGTFDGVNVLVGGMIIRTLRVVGEDANHYDDFVDPGGHRAEDPFGNPSSALFRSYQSIVANRTELAKEFFHRVEGGNGYRYRPLDEAAESVAPFGLGFESRRPGATFLPNGLPSSATNLQIPPSLQALPLNEQRAVVAEVLPAFSHRSCNALNESVGYTGLLYAQYPCGGFAVMIPFNWTLQMATAAMEVLLANGWLDQQTRLVLMSVITFNLNEGSFLYSRVAHEVAGGGAWVPSHIYFMSGIFQLSVMSWWQVANYFLFAVYLLAYFIGFVSHVHQATTRRKRQIGGVGFRAHFASVVFVFLDDFWVPVDLVNYALFFASWIGKAYFAALSQETLNEQPFGSGGGKFSFNQVSFFPSRLASLASLDSQLAILDSINMVVGFLKILKYIRLSKVLITLSRTMRRAANDLSGILLAFLILFIAFVLGGFVAYGNVLLEYSGVDRAASTLIVALFGEIDYVSMRDTQEIYTPIYVAGFLCLVVLTLLNMIIAVLTGSYEDIVAGQGVLIAKLRAVMVNDLSSGLAYPNTTFFRWLGHTPFCREIIYAIRSIGMACRSRPIDPVNEFGWHRNPRRLYEELEQYLRKIHYGSVKASRDSILQIFRILEFHLTDVCYNPFFQLKPHLTSVRHRTVAKLLEKNLGSMEEASFLMQLLVWLPAVTLRACPVTMTKELLELRASWIGELAQYVYTDDVLQPDALVTAEMDALKEEGSDGDDAEGSSDNESSDEDGSGEADAGETWDEVVGGTLNDSAVSINHTLELVQRTFALKGQTIRNALHEEKNSVVGEASLSYGTSSRVRESNLSDPTSALAAEEALRSLRAIAIFSGHTSDEVALTSFLRLGRPALLTLRKQWETEQQDPELLTKMRKELGRTGLDWWCVPAATVFGCLGPPGQSEWYRFPHEVCHAVSRARQASISRAYCCNWAVETRAKFLKLTLELQDERRRDLAIEDAEPRTEGVNAESSVLSPTTSAEGTLPVMKMSEFAGLWKKVTDDDLPIIRRQLILEVAEAQPMVPPEALRAAEANNPVPAAPVRLPSPPQRSSPESKYQGAGGEDVDPPKTGTDVEPLQPDPDISTHDCVWYSAVDPATNSSESFRLFFFRQQLQRARDERHVFAYLLFLSLFTFFLVSDKGLGQGVHLVNNVDNVLGNEYYLGSNPQRRFFSDVSSATELFAWLNQSVGENLFTPTDSLTRPEATANRFDLGNTFAVGAIKLRQIRSTSQKCHSLTQSLVNIDEQLNGTSSSGPYLSARSKAWLRHLRAELQQGCPESASIATPDRKPFGLAASSNLSYVLSLLRGRAGYLSRASEETDSGDPVLHSLDETNVAKDLLEAFAFHSGSELRGSGFYGGLDGSYGADGYCLFLRMNRSLEANRMLLKVLEDYSWIDEWTQFLAIEVAFFNYNTNLFVQARYFIEVTAGGHWRHVIQYYPLRIWVASTHSGGQIFITVVFVLMIIAYIVGFVSEIRQRYIQRKKELGGQEWVFLRIMAHVWTSSGWLWIDLLNYILLVTVWLFRFWLIITGLGRIDLLRGGLYPNGLEAIADVNQSVQLLDSINAVLVYIKLLYFVRLVPKLSVFTETLGLAVKDLVTVFCIVFIIVSGFAFAGYGLFSSFGNSFLTMQGTYASLTRMILFGDIDDEDQLYKERRDVFIIFRFLFIFGGRIILFNMLIAVLSKAFSEAKDRIFDATELKQVMLHDPDIPFNQPTWIDFFFREVGVFRELYYIGERFGYWLTGPPEDDGSNGLSRLDQIRFRNPRIFWADMVQLQELLELGSPMQQRAAACRLIEIVRDVNLMIQSPPDNDHHLWTLTDSHRQSFVGRFSGTHGGDPLHTTNRGMPACFGGAVMDNPDTEDVDESMVAHYVHGFRRKLLREYIDSTLGRENFRQLEYLAVILPAAVLGRKKAACIQAVVESFYLYSHSAKIHSDPRRLEAISADVDRLWRPHSERAHPAAVESVLRRMLAALEEK